MVTVFTLTPANAAQALRDNGLDALGLTAVRLWPSWGNGTPTFDASALTLTYAALLNAPWRGIMEYLDNAAAFRSVDGTPLSGPAAALRLHPQAAVRLASLATSRYGVAGQPQVRVVPETMLIQGISANQSPQNYEAGDPLPGDAIGSVISFHDARGFIVDPIAVAAMLDDLLLNFVALDGSAGGTVPTGSGGVRTIAGLASGVIAHIVTLHGRAFAAIAGGPGITKLDSGGNPAGAAGAGGLVSLIAGESIAGSGAAAAAQIRLGWAAGGTMSAAPITPPALPAGVTLARQFVRAFAVDLDWHLRGNRSNVAVGTIAGDDQLMPDDLKPQVRDGVTIDYLADGPDMLSTAAQVIARIIGAAPGGLMFAVSPLIDAGVGVPTTSGALAHWPAFPPPNTNAGLQAMMGNPVGVTATWSGTNDVVVVIPANFAPDGASVRIYSQLFQLIEAIGEEPSFLRGDGGSALAATGNPVQILVRNPFGLLPGDPLPNPATLVYDLVIAARTGQRRIWAAQQATVAAGPALAPADPFAAPDVIAPVPVSVRAICPVPLFGMTRTVTPAGGAPATPAAMALALLSETQPRQGPRLPMMARHETIIVTGIADATVTAGLAWDAVLTGGRWSRETLSAQHGDGNPGNPAGPDTHAPGVRVTGVLAHDVARHAIRRVQPIIPLPGPSTPGWIVMSGGNNFNPPVPAAITPTDTSVGVALQSVAAIVETPELSLLADSNPLGSPAPINFQQLLAQLATAMGLPNPPAISIANEDRLINEVRREFFLSKRGNRDTLWALNRAVSEADELIYIEGAGFARTARPSGAPAANEIDLVQRIADRMNANPNLRVIVCIPRDTDFAPAFAPFVRRAIAQRTEAINILRSADAMRVTAFHPRGFPGRWAQLRTTSIIVDDVWCLTGATHFRRRGMTFDGSLAIASLDQAIEDGYSQKVRRFRRDLMAAKLGVTRFDTMGLPTSEWLRLERPASAFDLIADLVLQGGLGRLSPLWLGPSDANVVPQSDDVADPDGSDSGDFVTLLASLLSES